MDARRTPRFENKKPLLRDERDASEDSCLLSVDFSQSPDSASWVGSLPGGGRNARDDLPNFQSGRSSQEVGVDRGDSSNHTKYHDLVERNERELTR